jgi:hypothetical protein
MITMQSILRRFVDERFLRHRLQSTSIAGMAAAALSILLFYYRHLFDHVWSWDLLAVGVTFVAIKLGLMTWYFLTD